MANFQAALKGAFLSVLVLVGLVITITTSLYRTNQHRQVLFLYHDQEDKDLVESLQKRLIPPAYNAPYDLLDDQFEPSMGQGRVVRKLTNYKTGGFFVECGSGNGEFYSNTLFLERHLGWTGLLVEADPMHVQATLELNRKSWVAPFCMSLNTSAYTAFFDRKEEYTGRVLPEQTSNSFKVDCYPFLSFLLALNVTKVDYFSLDVEGHEVEILETVPFDKVDITVLSVEFSKARGGLLGVKSIMEEKGYKIVEEVPPDDLIFVKKSYVIPE